MGDKPPILGTVLLDAGMVVDLQHDNCLGMVSIRMASMMNYRLSAAELEHHHLHGLPKLASGVSVGSIISR
jgi:hypothetical protein